MKLFERIANGSSFFGQLSRKIEFGLIGRWNRWKNRHYNDTDRNERERDPEYSIHQGSVDRWNRWRKWAILNFSNVITIDRALNHPLCVYSTFLILF